VHLYHYSRTLVAFPGACGVLLLIKYPDDRPAFILKTLVYTLVSFDITQDFATPEPWVGWKKIFKP
jgi:hypothetical protein